jgi:hypothetical protein
MERDGRAAEDPIALVARQAGKREIGLYLTVAAAQLGDRPVAAEHQSFRPEQLKCTIDIRRNFRGAPIVAADIET